MNRSAYGLSEMELIILLSQLFSDRKLVAKNEKRGFFMPNSDYGYHNHPQVDV
jgi:hypothetical protein